MRAFLAFVVLSLSLVAHAEPMPLVEARGLVGKKALDEVYVAFSSLKKGTHPAGDVAVAQLLVEAARAALEAQDPSLALGLTDKARKLDPRSVDACLVNADALLALDQRGAAEEALEAALELVPKDHAVVFRRADYAEQEGQLDRALELFKRIPASHAQGAVAKSRVARLTAALAEQEKNLAELAQGERERVAGAPSSLPTEPGAPPPSAPSLPATPPSASDGVVLPDGMATRESSHFRIVYSGGQRDFAQRAQYEQKVLDLFERAYVGARNVLGRASPRKVDVVLYTADEFRFHFGSMFGGGVLGFYSGKIRMNRAESLDERFSGTAVHEYVHAVVDDVMGGRSDCAPVWLHEGLARWVERRVSGGDHIDFREKSELKRRGAALPTFAALSGRAATELGGDAWVPYAKGACAVEALSGGGGVGRLVRVLEATGKGRAFEEAFGAEFGATRLGQLDGEVAASVGK